MSNRVAPEFRCPHGRPKCGLTVVGETGVCKRHQPNVLAKQEADRSRQRVQAARREAEDRYLLQLRLSREPRIPVELVWVGGGKPWAENLEEDTILHGGYFSAIPKVGDNVFVPHYTGEQARATVLECTLLWNGGVRVWVQDPDAEDDSDSDKGP